MRNWTRSRGIWKRRVLGRGRAETLRRKTKNKGQDTGRPAVSHLCPTFKQTWRLTRIHYNDLSVNNGDMFILLWKICRITLKISTAWDLNRYSHFLQIYNSFVTVTCPGTCWCNVKNTVHLTLVWNYHLRTDLQVRLKKQKGTDKVTEYWNSEANFNIFN